MGFTHRNWVIQWNKIPNVIYYEFLRDFNEHIFENTNKMYL